MAFAFRLARRFHTVASMARVRTVCAYAASLLVGFATTAAAQSEASWVRTQEGCTFWTVLGDAQARVSSTVPCVNGRLEGGGIVKYFRSDGTQYWESRVGPERGIRYEAGKLVASIEARDVELSLPQAVISKQPECSDYVVLAKVQPDIGTEFDEVIVPIITLGRAYYDKQCRTRRGQPITIRVYSRTGSQSLAEMDRYGTRNKVRDSLLYYWNSMERRQTASSQQMRREQGQRQAAADVRTSVLQNREALAKRYGPFQLVKFSTIAPNPYAWKGKQIGLCIGFERMVAENVAQVGVVYPPARAALINVPSTRFTSPGAIFLVAKVEGQSDGVTILRYVFGIEQTNKDQCEDYVERR